MAHRASLVILGSAALAYTADALKGTLHKISSCDECGGDFCHSKKWAADTSDVEKTYYLGSTLAEWGCKEFKHQDIVRNKDTEVKYVVEAVEKCLGKADGCTNIGEGDGDCDHDSECAGGLKCGTNNCVGSHFVAGDDCCYDPEGGVFDGGWCEESKGVDQAKGQESLGTQDNVPECIDKCRSDPSYTACEWKTDSRECWRHTAAVLATSGDAGYQCYHLSADKQCALGRCEACSDASATVKCHLDKECKGKTGDPDTFCRQDALAAICKKSEYKSASQCAVVSKPTTTPAAVVSKPTTTPAPAPAPAPTPGVYSPTERTVLDEGTSRGDFKDRSYTVAECEGLCDTDTGCKSFAYNPRAGHCFLKTGCVTSGSEVVANTSHNALFQTYYKACVACSTPQEWIAPPSCLKTFEYKGNITGCTTIDSDKGWCLTNQATRQWAPCTQAPCADEAALPPVRQSPAAQQNTTQPPTAQPPVSVATACPKISGAKYKYTERVVQAEGAVLMEYKNRFYAVFECEALCNQDATCRSFAYSDKGHCFLKSGCVTSTSPMVAESAPNAFFKTYYQVSADSVESALTLDQQEAEQSKLLGFLSLDRVAEVEGTSIGAVYYQFFSPKECAAVCLALGDCNSFTYSSQSGACHLKDQCVTHDFAIVASGASMAEYKTYYRPCNEDGSRPPVTDVPQQAYFHLTRVAEEQGANVGYTSDRHYSPDECKMMCNSIEGCRNFAYNAVLGECHFKTNCMFPTDPMVAAGDGRAVWETYFRPCSVNSEKSGKDKHLQRPLANYFFTQRVVEDEGQAIVDLEGKTQSLAECLARCDVQEKCHSVSFGEGNCQMKDKCLVGTETLVPVGSIKAQYQSFFRPCGAASNPVRLFLASNPVASGRFTFPTVLTAAASIAALAGLFSLARRFRDSGLSMRALECEEILEEPLQAQELE